jgi:metallo-beta-lactamase class B
MTCLSGFPPEGFPAQRRVVTKDLQVEELVKDVWRHISYRQLPTFGRSPANGLIVLAGKEAALVDTPWSHEQTVALFEWVEKNLGAQITLVVVTHYHDDCLGGLGVAHDGGAESWALEETAKLARDAEKEVPQKTFRSFHELLVGSRRMRLHYAGGGHTGDNIVIWLPEERILFGGCLVRSATAKHLGYTKEAALTRWPATIEVLIREYRDARLIVPGHGKPGGHELLRHTLDLLQRRD